MQLDWKPTFYGWAAFHAGHRLTVSKYRKGKGRGFVYVARLDQSASSSPAQGHRTIAGAKKEASAMLIAATKK